jgi:multimeric flavodoxin WrbA
VHTIVWTLFAGCILAIASLCTQAAGEMPGQCILGDGMATLTQKIETADGIVLASPTNFYTVAALFKRFMERLVVCAY